MLSHDIQEKLDTKLFTEIFPVGYDERGEILSVTNLEMEQLTSDGLVPATQQLLLFDRMVDDEVLDESQEARERVLLQFQI